MGYELDCYPYTFSPLLLFAQSNYFDKVCLLERYEERFDIGVFPFEERFDGVHVCPLLLPLTCAHAGALELQLGCAVFLACAGRRKHARYFFRCTYIHIHI